jgi:hypothetical protein
MFIKSNVRSTHRISIGPGEVAGYLSQLRSGFERCGILAEHFLYVPAHRFAYDVNPYFFKSTYEIFSSKLSGRTSTRKALVWIFNKIVRFLALFYAIFKYDVFIFSGFGSFFRFWELPLLKFLNKKIVVVYLGSDARPPYMSGKHLDDARGEFDPFLIYQEAKTMVSQIRRVERYATAIVNHTGTAQFFQRPFIRLAAVGSPMGTPTQKVTVGMRAQENSTLRILHAPSRPIAKGSAEIRDAIEQLRSEGFDVEFVELRGVPNATVLQELACCDLVIDELYSDVPMAMFAAEAATLGKPTIVGSLYANEFFTHNPDATYPPTIFVRPENLLSELRALVEDAAARTATGFANRMFVETEWSPARVADNYLKVVRQEAPDNWWCVPTEVDYAMGWGLSVDSWLDQMRVYLSAVGPEGLLLDHNPLLKRKILDLVGPYAGAQQC